MYLGFERLKGDLPIFRRVEDGAILYYAPGYVVRAARAIQPEIEAALSAASSSRDNTGPGIPVEMTGLIQHARAAQTAWQEIHTRPYTPVCLTVYLENRCNLRCIYCYSDPQTGRSPSSQVVNLQAIRDAAELVAANCQARGLPLTFVAHGGGEPALHLPRLRAAVEAVEMAAGRYGTGLFKYIATNGVMPAEKARWVADHFNLIGLSCDGPDPVQNQQRPLASGGGSAAAVACSAAIWRDMGVTFNVRVTLLPENFARQGEIVEVICRRFKPQEIHVEPVYLGGRAANGTFSAAAGQPEEFVDHFTRAQAAAALLGVRVLFAGTRPWETHGPYCQIFRDVLNLTPGNQASACFKLSNAEQVMALNAAVGSAESDGFWIDQEQVQRLRARLSARPATCLACFNQYHCTRGCPDQCALEQPERQQPDDFRCQVQMLLASQAIDRAAAQTVLSHDRALAGAAIRLECV